MVEATAHASWVKRRSQSYERLAFVGDSLLSQIVTLHLDSSYPKEKFPPGVLTRMRARVVADDTLRVAAARIGLDELAVELAPAASALQAKTVVATGKPLASMFEALIAACWQHHGPDATSVAVITCLSPELDAAALDPIESKSRLQELLAQRAQTVLYKQVSQSGPPHAPVFTVEAVIDPTGEVVGTGSGTSKKVAEAVAAEAALGRLDTGRK